MATPPTVDAPPTWSNTVTSTDTVTPAADGLSAEITPLAAGTDAISVSLNVGGKNYSVTVDVTVDAPAQELTSLGINFTP